MSKEIDLSSIPDTKRSDKIAAELESLRDEEKIVFKCGDNFFPLMADIRSPNEDFFIWAPLTNGPDIWRGEAVKTEKGAGFRQSVAKFMARDHRRCDDLYAAGEAAGLEGNASLAKELSGAFILGMRRHFSMEETIFFPAFTEATGMTAGPVEVMKMEHQQMKDVLTKMNSALDGEDMDALFGLGDTMVILMQQHNVKEESILWING